MDNFSLRLFLSLAHHLHFGRAGQECGLSPSAVSRTIARLEDELGGRLFLRDQRTVELTAAGRDFRLFALETLERWEQLKNRQLVAGGSDQNGLHGEIRLYSSVTAAYTVLADIFAAFRERYPNLNIRLQTGDPAEAIDRLQNHDIDLTVAALPGSLARKLSFKLITTTPLLFIAPAINCEVRNLTENSPIHWSRVPMILPETGLSRKRADAWFRAVHIKPRVYAEVSGHEAIVAMVRLGCGVGVVPRLALSRLDETETIRILPVKPELEPYQVGLCVQTRRLESAVVRAFWNLVPDGNATNDVDQSCPEIPAQHR